MISPVFLWIPVLGLGLAGTSAAAFWAWKRRLPRAPRPLPVDWQLSPRPVFDTDERRMYRLLREALPHHAILAKLPLVRFSQPDDPNDVRYWYELLGTTHVAFAICSTNGRVLAAIDLDSDHANARRTLQIKQAVLAACRVRYLRCPMDNLPTVAELQALVPPTTATRNTATRSTAAPRPTPARARPSTSAGDARAGRSALWQDSALHRDSFFALETRADDSVDTDPGRLPAPARDRRFIDHRHDDDIAGLVD